MDRVRRLLEARKAYQSGLYGQGIGVAVVDSGINDRHPDLKGRVVYAYNYLTDSDDASDDCGHGTHISGIIGGTGEASGGRYQGLAPRCHFVSLKILDSRGNGDSAGLIRALYWLMEHGREYDVRIINISVGGKVQRETARTDLICAVEEAWDAGFVICAAAGNQGPASSSITVPGTSEKVITVGSSDDELAVPVRGIRKAHYSGRGPEATRIYKPETVAPGAEIRSCRSDFSLTGNRFYTVKSGTSMATSVAAGALALLLSGEPGLTNQRVKERLQKGCRDLGLSSNHQGYGEIWLPGLLGKV